MDANPLITVNSGCFPWDFIKYKKIALLHKNEEEQFLTN